MTPTQGVMLALLELAGGHTDTDPPPGGHPNAVWRSDLQHALRKLNPFDLQSIASAAIYLGAEAGPRREVAR